MTRRVDSIFPASFRPTSAGSLSSASARTTYRQILLPTDGSPGTDRAVDQARRFRDALEAHGYEAGTDIEQKIRAFRILADFLARRVPVAKAGTDSTDGTD